MTSVRAPDVRVDAKRGPCEEACERHTGKLVLTLLEIPTVG